MGIFEKFYKQNVGLISESKEVLNLDESAILIEYIQELEEKLAVFVKGVAPKGTSIDSKVRSPDHLKSEPEHAASRKAAADKIRASRKATGAKGKNLEDHDPKNISVHKI